LLVDFQNNNCSKSEILNDIRNLKVKFLKNFNFEILILKFGNLALFKSFGNGHPGYGTTIGGWKF
jgi:hypothetical protein